MNTPLSFAALTGGLALYLQHNFQFDVARASSVFGLSGFIGALVQGALRKLARRFGEERLALFGLASMATGYVFLGFAHHVSVLVVLIILGSIGGAVVRPSLTTLLTKSVGEQEQGMVLGVSQSLGSMAQAVGPAAATWLIGREQIVLFGVFCSVFSVLGCLVAALRDRDEGLTKQAPLEG